MNNFLNSFRIYTRLKYIFGLKNNRYHIDSYLIVMCNLINIKELLLKIITDILLKIVII
jgi:hypothetical protein